MFYAQLIDAKDNKLSGKGSYVRTGVGTGDASWVALALAKQLEGSGRRRSAPTPARSYPAELDIEMVFVEGGTFEMGCTSEQSGCNGDEYPVHTVTLSNFNIGKYTVTRAQWLTVMKGHPTLANPPTNFTDDDQLPIERVYWDDIDTAFLPRLRALTGKNYRLLTEAEWEYAARGGKHKSTYMYSGSDNLDEVSWNVNNSGGKLHPVGQLKPNALGIYDMSGNIWEWCSDWYSNSYNAAIANGNTNPKGPDAGTCHASRGGRMNLDVMYLRVSSRFALCLNSGRYNVFGFRLALDAQ
jgi:formylglycine-generating enzyme required for sulfatase activity